ncbi:MAG TPA: hypothetical protein VM097_01445 [Mycobacteriales bacterium]|nr:hypothetical protein [Mycobacteriales bacterium]
MARAVVRVVDLLVDDDARSTWAKLSEQEQSALVRWVNKPATNRGRLERRQEAITALQLGGATTGLSQTSVLEGILTSLPWGTP